MDTHSTFSAAEYNQMGKTLYTADKFAEALIYYQKAEEADPMVRDTYVNQGECLIMLDRFGDAESAYNKALLIDKHDGELYFHLGNVAFLMGEDDKGRQRYADAVNEGFDDEQLYFNMGIMYLNDGYPEAAIEQFNKALSRNKFFADAWLSKAKAYLQQDKAQEALQALDSMIEHVPEVFEGHHYKAMVLVQAQKYDQAQKTLAKALKLFPDDLALHFDQLLLLEAQQQVEQALSYYEQHFSDSDDPLYLLEKGKILTAIPAQKQAGLLQLTALFGCADEDIARQARFLMVILDIGEARYEEAIASCDALIDTQLRDDPYYSALYFKGLAYQHLKDDYHAKRAFEAANAQLRMANSLQPGAMDYYILRAMCLKQLGNYEKAMELVNYMLTAAPDLPEALFVRSELYQVMHEPEKAQQDRAAAKALGGNVSQILQLIQGGEE